MNRNSNRSSAVTTVIVLLICLVIVTGSTFSLFTSDSKVNIAVTSGDVELTAVIDAATLALYSKGEAQTGNFANGGTAAFNDKNTELILKNITPGDSVVFNILLENESTVDLQYRVTWTVSGKLAGALVATVNGADITSGTSEWTLWKADAAEMSQTLELTIELPLEAGNEWEELEGNIAFHVEAVQANGVPEYEGLNKTYDAATMGGLYEFLPTLAKGSVLTLPAGTYVTTGTFTIPDGVTIKGEAGAEVIFRQDSAAQDNIFNCEGDAIIENITFESNRKGYAINGAAKEHDTDGNITVINCKFKGIAAEKNWGIYKNLNGDLIVKNCTFDNYNNALCGINNGGDSITEITGCTFTNINGEAIGYISSSVDADFESNVIANNTGLTAENVIGY